MDRDGRQPCALEHVPVRDLILPFDAEEAYETVKIEGIQPLFLI